MATDLSRDTIAVLIKNEKDEPYVFIAGRNGKAIQPGASLLVSDAEWDSVVFAQRGPGKLNPQPLDVAGGGGDVLTDKIEFDYYSVPTDPTSYEVRYMGVAPQTAAFDDALWTVKRFSHVTVVAGDNRITEIQVLVNVAWDDRETLPWT